MTPIAEIAELKIGSRPASRTKSDRIEDLRAIPWVFSWAQARVMLPGWYGVGQALQAFADQALLREMAGGLAVLPGDARQPGDGAGQVRHGDRRALRHAGRGSRAGASASSAASATAGRRRTTACSSITGQTRLLEKNPALDASIRLRLPYIEPLNLLQVELLKRHRAGETRCARARRHPAVDQRGRDGAAQQRVASIIVTMSPSFIRRAMLAALMFALPIATAAQVAPGALPAADRPFGTLREQAAMQQAWLKKRLDTFLPALMRKHGIDMWVVPMREYNEDPVFSSITAPETFAARRRTIYVFFDKCAAANAPVTPSCVERIALGGTSQGGVFDARTLDEAGRAPPSAAARPSSGATSSGRRSRR